MNSINYYVGFAQYIGNPNFKNEKLYYQSDVFYDLRYHILSLYRYWNIIQYFFPYKNLIDDDWDNVLSEFIPKFVNIKEELDYRLTVLALITRIQDTHAKILGDDDVLRTYYGSNYAPVEVRFVENKLVVTDFLHKSYGLESGLLRGDIILSINNKSINDIVKERLPYTPGSNYPTQLYYISNNILRTADSIIDIIYQRDNTSASLKLKCFSPKTYIFENDRKRMDTCLKFITPEIAFINPASLYYNDDIAIKILKTKGIIVDMRCYPSKFIVFSLGEYLMPDSTAFVKFSKTNIYNPGLFTFSDGPKVGKKNKGYYNGKVIIIVNETTFSQAEYTTMAFRVAPKALVIGSTTAGADGNVSEFFLPGGVKTMMSGIGIYYPDGRGTQRVGIIPGIEVKPTIEGIREGRDELLEKAVELMNEK